ncbi:hypothetical protein MHOL44478_23450 [Mycobacterium holsaticum DSM 44478]|nr:hypothetical protein [Mycolicibacterium holsaticum DSM 44478 = JCM 12374]
MRHTNAANSLTCWFADTPLRTNNTNAKRGGL